MKKSLKLILILCLVLGMAFILTGCPQRDEQPNETPQEQTDKEQEQENPGEEQAPETEANQLIEDQAPEGCSSCHKKTDDKDYRLSAEVEHIEGHPNVAEDATVKECIGCHGANSDQPFNKILHRVHLVDGEHYLDKYDKNCINCHRIADDGTVTIKGLEQD
ncbi:MAG: hypothetical protein H0Z35_10080 [Thermoanaerobacteraceae bacterium]|nr:hypothetical protein [Thermoanaerobacteraceae bacterium]